MALVSTFSDNVDFGSREFTDPAKRPQLMVTYDAAGHDIERPRAGRRDGLAPSHDRVNVSWTRQPTTWVSPDTRCCAMGSRSRPCAR